MKVKKQDVKIKNRNTTGKKVKPSGSGKDVQCIKDRLLSYNDDKLCASTSQQQEEKTEILNLKEISMPPETRRDYINGSAETSVLCSSEGILRQALLSFTCPMQEDKTMKETVSKKNDNVTKSQTIIINDIKLTCSSPVPLCPENVNIPVTSKDISHLTLPPKSGTLLTGSLPLESLPLVPIPPVSLTSGTFSHGALSLMSLSPGPLPPVSEIPRPGNLSSLSCSSESLRSTISSSLSGLGVVATIPTTFGGNSSTSSDLSSYEVSQLTPHSLKVLVSLSNVATSLHVSRPSPITTQTTASSKEGSVTLVYSSFPKLESSILNCQKILPLPPMSEVKSQHTSVLHTLDQGKVNAASSATNSSHIDVDGDDSVTEVIPVNTDVLSVTGCRSPSNISVLDTSVSNESDHGSSSNPIKLDDNQDSSDLGHTSSIPNVDVSHAVSFEAHSVSSPDLNHIIIPVSSAIPSGKENDNHSLTTQQINQIITIPLTSNTINGNSVGISIPIAGNAVPLSVPAQVSSGLLPMSCSLLPVSSSALHVSTNIHSTSVAISDTSGSLLGNSNSIQSSYPCALPSVSPNHMETSISGTVHRQHSRLRTDISSLVTVTSSMILPIMSTNSMTSVTSVPTTGISGVPVTSRTDSIPVTSVSTSAPSTSTSATTAMVFTTHNPSIEPVTSYAMQSPAEILSQLSKAGVFPTMSSSQVSSVLSALASDTCHLDLESDSSHHVELLTQQQLQVMNMSSSVDKVSTLTQTEDLELGHAVELECNINMEHRNNKVIRVPEQIDLASDDDRLMEQHLHLLNHTSERPHVSPNISLSNKNPSVTNITSVVSPQVSSECRVVDNQVALTSDSNIHKQLPSIYTRIVSKANSCSNEHIVSSLPRSDLYPKIDVQKQIIESMGRSANNDIVNNDQRLASLFIKPEDFENSLNQKIVRAICGIGSASKKRKLHVIDEDANEVNKEVKKSSSKDVELDDSVEEVACYKCKFCPFLTLEKKGVELHVQVAHRSQLSGNQQDDRQPIKCPGCKNIFFTSKSLRIHLSQDHLVGNEELKTLVELVMRFSKTKNRKRRKNLIKTQSSEISGPVNGEICDNKALDNNCVIEIRDSPVSEMPVDECSKIRVRNLNSETLPELNKTMPSTEVLQTDVVRDEDNSSGAADEVREGALVIDDDPLMQQKQNCEFQMIKTDAEAVGEQGSNSAVLCDEVKNGIEPKKQKQEKNPNSRSSPSVKKRQSRPKGSKNAPSENYENLPAGIEKESGYRCDIDGCAVSFRSHDNIEYHRRCHHEDKFICPECSQEMIHWNSLSTHLWHYHVIDMELYSCDMCSYKTNSLSKLMNLHRLIHGDERPFLCDVCGKGFKNPKQMRNHKTIHTPKQKSTVRECDICSRTFTSLRMLRVHKDNVHDKLRPHLCNYCGYSASSRSTLKMHMRQHTGEKPFHCDECEYETADHNSLRRHKMRHSGDKPYKCPHCSYACIQSSTFKAHLNIKHPGMESGLMFSCHLCSFRSVRKDNYLAHAAEHATGANPNNRQRKHTSPKPQVDSDKANQSKEVPARMEKSRLPVIINIANLSTLSNDNIESSGSVQLIYNGSSVEGLLQQSSENVEAGGFGVDMTTDSVIHLVGELDANSNNSVQPVSENVQTLCVANIETVAEMPLTPEFEAEQITGDIQDIKEPQELKFKVSEDIAS